VQPKAQKFGIEGLIKVFSVANRLHTHTSLHLPIGINYIREKRNRAGY
jgi:hypothetical protein